MMHRVFGHLDVLPFHPEVHPPAVGTSHWSLLGWGLCNQGGRLGFWKHNDKVKMGFVQTHPMGQGHDGGPGRMHTLICPSVEPASAVACSIAQTLLATATSGVKPHYTAHKVQLNVGGAFLAICCQSLPYTLGIGSLLLCSTPDAPNLCPIVPTHLSVYAGLTWGDFFGGALNAWLDSAWSLCTFGIGRYVDRLGKVGEMINHVLTGAFLGGRGTGLSTGPSNVGNLLQRAIDGDGVTSGARPSFTIFGFGIAEGADGGVTFASPFSGRDSGQAADGAAAPGGDVSGPAPWSS